MHNKSPSLFLILCLKNFTTLNVHILSGCHRGNRPLDIVVASLLQMNVAHFSDIRMQIKQQLWNNAMVDFI